MPPRETAKCEAARGSRLETRLNLGQQTEFSPTPDRERAAMSKTILSLALAATFAAGVALAGTASAQFDKSDHDYHDANEPRLEVIRGGRSDS